MTSDFNVAFNAIQLITRNCGSPDKGIFLLLPLRLNHLGGLTESAHCILRGAG